MPILFSAVAKEKSVIYKYASCDGNFVEILEEVLARLTNRNDKMTYSHGYYLFHYIIKDSYVYFCLTNKACQRSRAFLFLNQIKRRLDTSTGDFDRVLAEEMYRYSEDCGSITVMKGELDELNSIGVDSSERILGEKILMVQNENNLQYTKTTCIEVKPPEPVVISVKYSKRQLIKLALSLMLTLAVLYTVSPLPVFIITIVYIAWYVTKLSK